MAPNEKVGAAVVSGGVVVVVVGAAPKMPKVGAAGAARPTWSSGTAVWRRLPDRGASSNPTVAAAAAAAVAEVEELSTARLAAAPKANPVGICGGALDVVVVVVMVDEAGAVVVAEGVADPTEGAAAVPKEKGGTGPEPPLPLPVVLVVAAAENWKPGPVGSDAAAPAGGGAAAAAATPKRKGAGGGGGGDDAGGGVVEREEVVGARVGAGCTAAVAAAAAAPIPLETTRGASQDGHLVSFSSMSLIEHAVHCHPI